MKKDMKIMTWNLFKALDATSN